MKKYTITYRMSIEVEALTEEQAKEIFYDMDLSASEFVELVSIEED